MKLQKVEINSYAGISPDAPVILDFSQANWIKAIGDYGTGKSSLIDAILTGLGQKTKDDKDKINLDSNKIDIKHSFIGKDRRQYEVSVTKSKFDLRYSGESLPEPVSLIRELIGPVGTSPMIVKEAKLTDVIKWLSAYSNKSPEEFEKQMLKFKDGIKAAESSRAIANKSLKGLNEFLSTEPMYNEWEKSEKKYAKKPDLKELSDNLDTASKNSDKYLRAEEKMKRYQADLTTLDTDIADLELELEKKKKEKTELEVSIVTGEKFLKENKHFKKEFDEVKLKYDKAAEDIVDYNRWQEIKSKKKERDSFETAAQEFDATAKDLIQKRKEAQAEILPDIKGVELYVEDTHEDGIVKKEGLYYQGKNIRQLSETEFWGLVLQIWKKFKVKIIVIDNYGNLGSYAEELLTKLAKEGVYILTAEMDRKTKELTISYE